MHLIIKSWFHLDEIKSIADSIDSHAKKYWFCTLKNQTRKPLCIFDTCDVRLVSCHGCKQISMYTKEHCECSSSRTAFRTSLAWRDMRTSTTRGPPCLPITACGPEVQEKRRRSGVAGRNIEVHISFIGWAHEYAQKTGTGGLDRFFADAKTC